ncbi:hypothetical protein BU16DRAFT_123522 [Neofusicoccum parvum]|uniref:Uncharacterized protein n=1 Tax=Neofusicoccum parvum TaxID=310453 RepID=A0ACB5SHZ1_9PEZI|nr:hypothetical protein BU16DRAFT_123522 [Neofusicoccum parvum]
MGVEFSGSLSRDFLRADSPGLTGKDGYFGLTWDDPTAYVTSVLDEIMFRTAVDAARADAFEHVYQGNEDYNFSYFPRPQRLEVVETRTAQVFRSNYNFLAAALAVMALATLVVVPTFYDYWMLGRDTSLNPVEIAKAFGAPILHDARSSASAEELLKEVGVVNLIIFNRFHQYLLMFILLLHRLLLLIVIIIIITIFFFFYIPDLITSRVRYYPSICR